MTSQNLDSLRQKIDDVDKRLRALVAERMTYAKAVAETKAETSQPIYYRPAREAKMIRSLISEKAADVGAFPLGSMVQIYRELISASIEYQANGLTVSVCDDVSASLARRHFGAASEILLFDDAAQALAAVGAGQAIAAPLSETGLRANAAMLKEQQLFVVAALPFVQPDPAPQRFIIAKQPAEPSGDDTFLVYDEQSKEVKFAPKAPNETGDQAGLLGCFANPVTLPL